MKRNPRMDPVPGDKLSKEGYTRTVRLVSPYDRKIVYDEVAAVYGQKTGVWISMTNWRRWARRATVMVMAKGEAQ